MIENYESEILSKDFLKKYSNKKVPWGFGDLSYVVYKRTYSRKNKLGLQEEWWETIARCINGAQKIGAKYTKEEAERLYSYMFDLKGFFSGRGLWQLGTPTVDLIGNDSLLNCWVTKVSNIDDFYFIFTESMLGGGVGCNISREYTQELPRVKKGVKCVMKNTKDADFIVPDSKEGWAYLWRKILKSYLETGESFSYSNVCIRPAGEPLKTFGGIAPGPKPLMDGCQELCKILESREGKKLRTQDVADIICCGGQVVKSGGIRRTAIILLGDVDDVGYLNLKRWDLDITIPAYRSNSNNSSICNDYNHILNKFWEPYETGGGEPYGLFNLKNSKKFGRIGETEINGLNLNDEDIIGCNPCAEALLADKEACVSGNTPLITKDGFSYIKDCVNKEIEVWNGEKWSKVIPRKTGINNEIYRVSFSDGSFLDCNKNHKFSIKNRFEKDYKKVALCDIKISDGFSVHSEPFKIEYSSGKKYEKDAYTLGFTVGDGHIDKNVAKVILFGEKDFKCQVKGHEIKFSPPDDKYRIPFKKLNVTKYIDLELVNPLKNDSEAINQLFSWDKESILNFIAGLADADGSNTSSGGIRIYISEFSRASRIQLLLSKCGIKSSVNLCQTKGSKTNLSIRNKDLYYLYITDCELIPCRRLNTKNSHTAKTKGKWQNIKKITKLEKLEDVYCFEEKDRHMAVFGNVLTYQCNLAELAMNNITSKEEMLDISILLYKTQKAISSGEYLFESSNNIIHKKMRLGLGVTGVCQNKNYEEWCDFVYKNLRAFDKEYSKANNFPESIRLTVVKPSGTLSLLSGSTPGANPGYSKFHYRTVRFSSMDSLIPSLRDAGYRIEPEIQLDKKLNHDISVVYFPCSFDDNTKLESDSDCVDQLNRIKSLQTCWADQAVSNTVYYKHGDVSKIKDWLKSNYNSYIKTVSFLLHSGHGFDQAVLIPITEKEYNSYKNSLKSVSRINTESSVIDSLECTGGACPVR